MLFHQSLNRTSLNEIRKTKKIHLITYGTKNEQSTMYFQRVIAIMSLKMSREEEEKACYAQLNADIGQTDEELGPSFSQLTMCSDETEHGKITAALSNLEAAEEHPPLFVDEKCGSEVPIWPLTLPSGTYHKASNFLAAIINSKNLPAKIIRNKK